VAAGDDDNVSASIVAKLAHSAYGLLLQSIKLLLVLKPFTFDREVFLVEMDSRKSTEDVAYQCAGICSPEADF